MKTLSILTLAAAATMATASLSGCASISEKKCLTGNWGDIGYKDGIKGKRRDAISDYADDCADHGVTPNRELYLARYNEGLGFYCTYEKGHALGEEGASYNQVCSGALAADFSQGYDAGRIVYEI